MSLNPVPSRSDLHVDEKIRTPTPAWLEFFQAIRAALFGWTRTYTAIKTAFDFPLIAAGGQQTTTVAVNGARSGDVVVVTAKTQVAGLGVFGYVSANDEVTIVRFNYSAAGIDPAADDFRVIVFQQ